MSGVIGGKIKGISEVSEEQITDLGTIAEIVARKDEPNGYAGVNENMEIIGPIIPRVVDDVDLDTIVPISGEVFSTENGRIFGIGNGTDVAQERLINYPLFGKADLRDSNGDVLSPFNKLIVDGSEEELNKELDEGTWLVQAGFGDDFIKVSEKHKFVLPVPGTYLVSFVIRGSLSDDSGGPISASLQTPSGVARISASVMFSVPYADSISTTSGSQGVGDTVIIRTTTPNVELSPFINSDDAGSVLELTFGSAQVIRLM